MSKLNYIWIGLVIACTVLGTTDAYQRSSQSHGGGHGGGYGDYGGGYGGHQQSYGAGGAEAGGGDTFEFPQLEGDYDYKDPYLTDRALVIVGAVFITYIMGFTLLLGTIFLSSAQAKAVGRKKRGIEGEEDSSWLKVIDDIGVCSSKYLCQADQDFRERLDVPMKDNRVKAAFGGKNTMHKIMKFMTPMNCNEIRGECPVDVGFYIKAARFMAKMTGNS